jgi:hypothetical protein
METITINEAALANILTEIFRQRGRKYSAEYSKRLAAAVVKKARAANGVTFVPLEPVRYATDAEIKELFGIDPL